MTEGWDWGVITATGVVFTIVSTIGTFLFTRGGREALLRQQVANMKEATEAANARADKAEAANTDLRNQLQSHMISDAAAFAKLEALTAEAARGGAASEQRLTSAIDKLVNRIDNMSNQINNFVQRFSPAQQQPPQQTPGG